jgi:hypothetical protein
VFRFNKYLYPTVECIVKMHAELGGEPVPVSSILECMRGEGYSGIRNIYYGLEASIQDGYVVVEYSKDGRGKRRLYVPTLLGAVDAGIYRAFSEALYSEPPSPETVRAFLCSMRYPIFWIAVGRLAGSIASGDRGSVTTYSILVKALTGVEVTGMPKARLAVVTNNILNEVYSITTSVLKIENHPRFNGVLKRALGALTIRFTAYNAEQCHQA